MNRGIGFILLAVVAVVVRSQLQPPFPASVRAAAAETPPNAIEHGWTVYHRYGCALCHGGDGKGGFANPNAETEGKVPAVIYVAEGYTPAELRKLILDGTPTIGRADPKGPKPPYRMPGWRGRMGDNELAHLVEYLMSLYPQSAGEKWR